MTKFLPINDFPLLLKKFNSRDNFAFAQVYHLLYNELYHFTTRIHRDSEVIAEDVVHDIFIKVWESRGYQFKSIDNIKAYMFVAIKNRYRNHIDHQKNILKYNSNFKSNEENFTSDVVETETLSIITQAIGLLPEECARVFKLHLEGWSVKEIACKLNKAESTVYSQRNEAISLLKSKLNKGSLILILSILKNI